MTADGGVADYARAIEHEWSELSEGPVVLSPRDWATVLRWFENDVPLQLVSEALHVAAKHRRGIRGLGRLGEEVDAAWEAVRQGRTTREPTAQSSERGGMARDAWRRRAAEGAVLHPALSALLGELLSQLDGGEPARRVDEALDDRLLDVVPPTALAAAREAVDRQIEGFRGRMDDEVLGATIRKGLLDRLRRDLELPHLADDVGP
ncbi:MAG: hypothetical protein GY716_11890 [bacterium]|nr:hypothetical protein [bacterium]